MIAKRSNNGISRCSATKRMTIGIGVNCNHRLGSRAVLHVHQNDVGAAALQRVDTIVEGGAKFVGIDSGDRVDRTGLPYHQRRLFVISSFSNPSAISAAAAPWFDVRDALLSSTPAAAWQDGLEPRRIGQIVAARADAGSRNRRPRPQCRAGAPCRSAAATRGSAEFGAGPGARPPRSPDCPPRGRCRQRGHHGGNAATHAAAVHSLMPRLPRGPRPVASNAIRDFVLLCPCTTRSARLSQSLWRCLTRSQGPG